MENLRSIIVVLFLGIGMPGIYGQSTFAMIEATTIGCGPVTDCDDEILCFRIVLTPAWTADVESYNIWVTFPVPEMGFVSDDVCMTDYGTPNTEFLAIGAYRVSGVGGDSMVTAGVPVILHTICLSYSNLNDIDGELLHVGGDVFGVLSTLTYSNPTHSEPNLPQFNFTMNETTVSCFQILPITWISFEAKKHGETARLNWSTAGHDNEAGFEIERSSDGNSFEVIGTHDALDPDEVNTYLFVDSSPGKGINYYRIKQRGKDGTFEYSPIRIVGFGEHGLFVRAWPNPTFDDVIQLEIYNQNKVESEIRLINLSGQEVLYQRLAEGQEFVRLDVGAIPQGVYSLLVESPEGRFVEKIVIVK